MAFLLFLFIANLILGRKTAWIYALLFGLSFPFWSRTFGVNFTDSSNEKAAFSVLSYNVMTFDVLNYLDNKNPQNALDMMKWAVENESDIKCFQEFYSHFRPNFGTLTQFKEAGYPYKTVSHPKIARNEESFIGLAIISKFPIVGRGEKEFEDMNGMIYADIKIKQDTIRVINVHLRSLIVRFGGIKKAYKNEDFKSGKAETRKVLSRLKYGFEHHAEEVEAVLEWVKESPYPVMVCGDFNETPYSYAYGKIRQKFNNAFEEKGKGFSFTYKDSPKIIRIDNQFYDKQALEIVSFKTRSDVKYSDHFPIVGRYKVKRNNFTYTSTTHYSKIPQMKNSWQLHF